MGQYIIRRFLITIPILFGVTLLTYLIINASGDPLQQFAFNPRTSPETIERIRENLGLNEPWYVRYFVWLGNVLTGDLGDSMITFRPVLGTILDAMPYTILLSFLGIAVSLLIALPMGIYSALHRNGIVDRIFSVFSTAGYAVPIFWLSLLLIIVFSTKFREWGLPNLPSGGMMSNRGADAGSLSDRIQHLILPLVALTLPSIAAWSRYIRSSMLEEMGQDFVRTARAKGLRNRIVIYRHALRNALLPLITLVGLTIPDIFAGALIIETVFAYQGMGRVATDALFDKDYTMIMGTTLMYAVLIILGNLIADVLQAIADPRIRYD
ncbi:MAG TPA: ABC transporter permease [Thermomicrobiales bacterium]|jgi:peptide/nickel transport system permease protein|nr:ABC transporter permease [Thermomicrobiales bacterium]